MKMLVTDEQPRRGRTVFGEARDVWGDADAIEVDEFDDADSAAEKWIDKRWADLNYPKGPVRVWVKDADDIVTEVEITIEFEPVFGAGAVRVGAKQCEHRCVREETCLGCFRPMPGVPDWKWENSL